jgi:SAM-dependent methyltransferase
MSQAVFDPIAFKKTTTDQWNNVAGNWNAWGGLLQSWLGPPTDTMLDMARVTTGSDVLHVAGGSGQEALQTARRVGPGGYVLTTDVSEKLTKLAKENAEKAGFSNIEAQVMDGESLDVPPQSFDAVTSRVGLIFFPDQKGSVHRQVAALKPGGYVGAVVYATAEENRFFSDPVGIIRRRAGLGPPLPGQPGPFSLGGEGTIAELFRSTGLVDIEEQKIAAPVVLDSAAECLRFEQESFGALHQMLAQLDEAEKQAAWDEVGEALAAFETGGCFEGPCMLIVAVGRKP